MLQLNENFLKLPGNYLFAKISQKIDAFEKEHPDERLIRLGIGDVTQPLVPAVLEALHAAVDEQGARPSFQGYGPESGHAFLREAIAADYLETSKVSLSADEIHVSDGSKCDVGNFQEIFSGKTRVAVCDPVYPVYVDSNVMAGRAGTLNPESGRWDDLIYLECLEENDFCPQVPGEMDPVPDLIYLCFPNNPTGSMIDAARLGEWVDYARRHGSLILYDAAYAAFIQGDYPRSIFEIDGARECAVEFCSFSKRAGFTGLRLAYTVIPQELKVQGVKLSSTWQRRQATKFNGASILSQVAGAAVFKPEAQKQLSHMIRGYQENATMLREGLEAMGFTVYGGKHAPYLWLKVPEGLTSWQFFDRLLQETGVVGTPGSGFGPCGEGYFRLTAFGKQEDTQEALRRMDAANLLNA